MQTSKPDFELKKKHALHLIAPLIGLAWVVFENMRPDEETEIIVTGLFNNIGLERYGPISIVSGLSFIMYSIYILRHHPMYLTPLKDKTLKTALLFLFTSIVFASIMILAVFNSALSLPLASFGNAIVSIGCVSIFLWHYRRPKHFEEWVYQVRDHQYKNSQLKGIDTSDIEDTLHELFEVEKIHLDGNLTLGQCSLKVGLSTHQLSEYLNSKKRQSFTAFINTYRIKEAQRLLLEHPDMSSLRIGFESGFNSDATFNRNFKNITGMSPGKYRKAHQ
jgi:AraC-like DNA-binding protein